MSAEFWATVVIQIGVGLFCYGRLWERVRGHGKRLDGHDKRLDGVEGEVKNHETRISHLEGRRPH